MAGVASSSRQRSKIAPYLMVLPALVYLGVFFVVPFFSLAQTSLSSSGGSIYMPTLTFGWDFGNYLDAFNLYRDQIIRSFSYALVATILCVLLAFPLAYVIAFKAGRYKNLILGLVILPFFVTFLIRTIAWKTILADEGWVVSALGSIGMLPDEGRLLSTSWAVIGGLTYNWIIFMILPLYVSLEKIDPRLIEASKDLYSSNARSFSKVILPLSMPGVLAGSMLVFIPAVGDFINADYLGSTQTTMIGNVIQKQFLVVKDYPAAAALSLVLMLIILSACCCTPAHWAPRIWYDRPFSSTLPSTYAQSRELRFTVRRPPTGEVSPAVTARPAAMLRAALTSALHRPAVQASHSKTAWLLRFPGATCPHAEHRCEGTRPGSARPGRKPCAASVRRAGPSRFGGCAVEPAFLGDSDTRLLDGAARRPGHRPHVEPRL